MISDAKNTTQKYKSCCGFLRMACENIFTAFFFKHKKKTDEKSNFRGSSVDSVDKSISISHCNAISFAPCTYTFTLASLQLYYKNLKDFLSPLFLLFFKLIFIIR